MSYPVLFLSYLSCPRVHEDCRLLKNIPAPWFPQDKDTKTFKKTAAKMRAPLSLVVLLVLIMATTNLCMAEVNRSRFQQ